MLVQNKKALFLHAEKIPFTNNKGEKVEYVKAIILDDNDEYHVCSVAKDIEDTVLALENRTEGEMAIEITEQENDKGKYLKKKIVAVD